MQVQDVANPSIVESASTFLTVMSALSTAVQQFVEHVIKKRLDWLDATTPTDTVHEARRTSAIHVISFVVGAALCWSVELKPLMYLGVESGVVVNALLGGIMISFGSSFFDEALGALREFKKAQATIRPTK